MNPTDTFPQPDPLLSRWRDEDGESPLAAWARGLRIADEGIWYPRAEAASAISYPDDGNDCGFAVEDRSFWFRHRNDCIIEIMRRFPSGGPVFDIGGGNGCVASALQRNGIDAVMVEPGPQGARNARRRGVENVVCAAFETTGLPSNAVPAIGLFDVIEHVPDDGAFLREVRNVLRPGGRVYMTVPALPMLWSADDVLAGHFRRYSLRTLTTLLSRSGFEVELATYLFSFLFLPIALFRAIPSRLRIRRAASGDQDASSRRPERDHDARGGFRKRAVEYFCDRELSRLNTTGSRFGTSCIAVARAR